MRLVLSAVLGTVLLLAGCSGPGEKEVRIEFLRAHPAARIESLAAGEGDGDHVYYHIRFREAGDLTPRDAVWLYTRQKDGSWRNTRRDQP